MYYLKNELGNEVYKISGMKIAMDDLSELTSSLRVNTISNLFVIKEAESFIKTINPDQLVEFTKELEIDKIKFHDLLFTHPDGNIYDYSNDFNMLRTAQLLSSKYEGYPLHLFKMGPVGTGKTTEDEVLDYKFQEEQGILEAANSTLKSIVPSFKEKPANLGYICKCNRIAIIDEMMKMVDNAMNNTRNSTEFKNQLSNLNFILEHRSRRANSGNGNLFCKPTAKMIVTTNPSMKSKYIHEELSVIDPSTFSRCLCYVKGESHVEFIEKNELRNCANTYPLYCNKGETNEKIYHITSECSHKI